MDKFDPGKGPLPSHTGVLFVVFTPPPPSPLTRRLGSVALKWSKISGLLSRVLTVFSNGTGKVYTDVNEKFDPAIHRTNQRSTSEVAEPLSSRKKTSTPTATHRGVVVPYLEMEERHQTGVEDGETERVRRSVAGEATRV